MSRKYLHDLLDVILNHRDFKLVDTFVESLFEELHNPLPKSKPIKAKIVS